MYARRLCALCFVLACACMWGCGDWYPKDGERVFSDHYGTANVVGFVDDSLAIVADARPWSQETPDYAIGGYGHQRLRVFNYRVQEDGPRWTDTLDNFVDEFDYVKGQLSDSVVWGSHGNEQISFWKLGEKPIVHEISVKMDGCKVDFAIKNLRKWLDGLILASGIIYYAQSVNDVLNAGGDTCQYAVLDTIAKTLTYKKLNKDLMWIKKCDDVRVWEKDVYCLYFAGESLNLYLSKNDVDLDSLMQGEPYGWASYTKVGFAGDMLNLGNNVCAIVNSQFSCLGVSIRGDVVFKTEGLTITY